jgi:hypothetical protein
MTGVTRHNANRRLWNFNELRPRHEGRWGTEGIAPRVLNLSTRWRWENSLNLQPLHSLEKGPQCPLNKRLGMLPEPVSENLEKRRACTSARAWNRSLWPSYSDTLLVVSVKCYLKPVTPWYVVYQQKETDWVVVTNEAFMSSAWKCAWWIYIWVMVYCYTN